MPLSRGRRRKPQVKRSAKGREHSSPSRFQIDSEPVDEAAMMTHIQQLSDNVDDNVRVVFMTDPEVGGSQYVTGLEERAGKVTPTFEGADLEEPMPVALFEPARAMVLAKDGKKTEAQAEAAIQLGLQRWLGSGALQTSEGWQVIRTSTGLQLREPGGTVFSQGQLLLPPQWISAAVSQGFVIVRYGVQLGVRTPPGTPEASYTAEQRWQELRTAQRAGIVAAGIVTYVNDGREVS